MEKEIKMSYNEYQDMVDKVKLSKDIIDGAFVYENAFNGRWLVYNKEEAVEKMKHLEKSLMSIVKERDKEIDNLKENLKFTEKLFKKSIQQKRLLYGFLVASLLLSILSHFFK